MPYYQQTVSKEKKEENFRKYSNYELGVFFGTFLLILFLQGHSTQSCSSVKGFFVLTYFLFSLVFKQVSFVKNLPVFAEKSKNNLVSKYCVILIE